MVSLRKMIIIVVLQLLQIIDPFVAISSSKTTEDLDFENIYKMTNMASDQTVEYGDGTKNRHAFKAFVER